ncbi:MAG: class I SAM-dependent methyltransferase [Sphaerochaeta sp.]|nr:class I SAM-dependent methyltransferase [Sphaerochaeta sp.]
MDQKKTEKKDKAHHLLFNTIAPIYGLFFNRQKRKFMEVIQRVKPELNLPTFRTILDVGCGTGALCSVLHQKGLEVTGIEPALKMLDIARRKTRGQDIRLLQANVLEGLPFENKAFDISIASYVAHGLLPEERKRLYKEMGRVSSKYVIIYDYNQTRSKLTSLVEWMEGGDYFRFIKSAEKEMKGCVSELRSCFSEVRVIHADVRAAWYVCTPL